MLEGCCSSKRRERDEGDDYDLNDYSSMGAGGILGGPTQK